MPPRKRPAAEAVEPEVEGGDAAADGGEGSELGPPAPKRIPTPIARVADVFAIAPGSGEHVVVIVEEADKPQESFHIPVDILTKHSPVFAAMFQGGFAEARSREVHITQFTSASVRDFIELLVLLELRNSKVSITFPGEHVCEWIKSVAPLVKYYQCKAAEDFLAEEVDDMKDLGCLAAFEEVFCDGEAHDWSKSLYKELADDCINVEKCKYREQNKAPVYVGCNMKTSSSGKHAPGSHIGWLCKEEVSGEEVVFLEKLRPRTLVKLMAAIVEGRYTVDPEGIKESAFKDIKMATSAPPSEDQDGETSDSTE